MESWSAVAKLPLHKLREAESFGQACALLSGLATRQHVIQGLNAFLVYPRDKERKIETMEIKNTREYRKVKEES